MRITQKDNILLATEDVNVAGDYEYIGIEKHGAWIVDAWRWLSRTRVKKYRLIVKQAPKNDKHMLDRLARTIDEMEEQKRMNVFRSYPKTPQQSFKKKVTGDWNSSSTTSSETTRRRDDSYSEYGYPFTSDSISDTPSVTSHSSSFHFGGGDGSGSGASGSWGDSYSSGSHSGWSSSSSSDSWSSSDSSSDSGGGDSGGGDGGGGD